MHLSSGISYFFLGSSRQAARIITRGEQGFPRYLVVDDVTRFLANDGLGQSAGLRTITGEMKV
jgi:hypothetical protein